MMTFFTGGATVLKLFPILNNNNISMENKGYDS